MVTTFTQDFHSSILLSSHALYLWFLYGSEKKQRFLLMNFSCLVYITEFGTSKAQWSLYVPTDYHWTFLRSAKIVTLCFFCECMCLLLIWGQTPNITLYSINWLDYITEISPSKSQLSLYVPTVYHSKYLHSALWLFLWVHKIR